MIESGTRREHRTSVVARHEPGRGLVWRARCREPECEHPPTRWWSADGTDKPRRRAERDARSHALHPTGVATITSLAGSIVVEGRLGGDGPPGWGGPPPGAAAAAMLIARDRQREMHRDR